MAISDWPLAERPRERLLAKGAKTLSDAELLAVILRTGMRGKSAVELGRDLLARFNSVAGLFGADLSDMKGLGPAKCAQYDVVIELRCGHRAIAPLDCRGSAGKIRPDLRIEKSVHPGFA